MRILLLGATGLIGSAVAGRLAAQGHELIGVARRLDSASRRLAIGEWIRLDLRDPGAAIRLVPALATVDAVVNCAGSLQASFRDSPTRLHADFEPALWRACEEARVGRIVHLSAMGADQQGVSEFSRSKRVGDLALEQSRLDWVILRPSVVVGRAAYGGSALLRGLAALPVLPRIAQAAPLDIVQLDDVTETVAFMLEPDSPGRIALDLPGPDRLAFAEVVAAYRSWLGWAPAREIIVPNLLMALAWRIGDLVAWLGWRPAIRTTARLEIARGAMSDSKAWRMQTGIAPRSLLSALAAEPASIQERWHSRLYFLKPLALFIFASYWIVTGLVSLGPGWAEAVAILHETKARPLAEYSVFAGALADIAIGLMIMFRRTAKKGLLLALAVSILYLLLGTLLIPALWSDPLGAMVKILPILTLNLVCLALLDER